MYQISLYFTKYYMHHDHTPHTLTSVFCAIFYLERLKGAYVSHLTVTNCLWWGYLTVFVDFPTGGKGVPIYWLYNGYVPLERV